MMVEKIQIRRAFVMQYMIENDMSLNQLADEIGISCHTQQGIEWSPEARTACHWQNDSLL